MSYRALSEEEAKSYALSVPNLFPEQAVLQSREIGDGNLNLVFHIKDIVSGHSMIFKQALPYARVVGESWPLTIDRARIESEALLKQGKLCPDLVPKVYHYDADLALTIMEDLSDHVIMRKGLIEGLQYPLFAAHISRFLANTLFFQSDFYLSAAEKKQQVIQFSNPELCKITEDLVFTDPYYDAPTNSFNPLITSDVQAIWKDDALKQEIAQLKYDFLTSAQALIHGDLHTGSIFVTQESTKVIDPEFAYFGPMGFDIGAIYANLVLNYAAQHGHMQNEAQRIEMQAWLLETIDQIWDSFEAQFRQLALSQATDRSLKDSGFIDHFLQKVKADALGFAGCKVLRRVIGLASVADLESIQDETVRAQCERISLKLGRALILNRKTWAHQQARMKQQLESIL